MSTITIELTDDSISRLEEKASRLGVTAEDLVRASVEDLLSQPDETFQRAIDYVLRKNADLYRRLAG
jgi:hypothetical protein